MKAVIVDMKNGFVSVFTDDGCVVKMKNNNYEIGQVIQIASPDSRVVKKITVFVASAAAVFVLGIGTWAYASPYYYVSLDVNPSIEYTVNRFDRVLSIKAVNDDGDEILEEVKLENLKNKTIRDALTNTVEQITEAGYFEGSEGGIVITTSAKNKVKAEDLAQDLEQAVEEAITESGNIVEVESSSVGIERVKEARELGVTPGKLNLAEKLKESASDPDSINIEEWLDKPVKDIMKATKENKESSKALKEDNDPAESNDPVKATGKEQEAEDKSKDNEDKPEEKADDKEDKTEEKAEDKIDKTEEKPDDKADKEADKAEENADDKTDKDQEKSDDKADKAEEKADDNADKTEEKADDKADKDQGKVDEKAVKDEDSKTPPNKESVESTENPDDDTGDVNTTEDTGKVEKEADKEDKNESDEVDNGTDTSGNEQEDTYIGTDKTDNDTDGGSDNSDKDTDKADNETDKADKKTDKDNK